MDEVKDALVRHNEKNKTNFVIDTNGSKSFIIKCAHGVKRKSRSKGKRPSQHVNYLGCPALINIYKSQKDDTMKVTKVDENHKNHRVGVSVSHTLNEEEIELVTTLRQANTKPSQIRECLASNSRRTFPRRN